MGSQDAGSASPVLGKTPGAAAGAPAAGAAGAGAAGAAAGAAGAGALAGALTWAHAAAGLAACVGIAAKAWPCEVKGPPEAVVWHAVQAAPVAVV